MLAWLAIPLGCVNKGEGEPTGLSLIAAGRDNRTTSA